MKTPFVTREQLESLTQKFPALSIYDEAEFVKRLVPSIKLLLGMKVLKNTLPSKATLTSIDPTKICKRLWEWRQQCVCNVGYLTASVELCDKLSFGVEKESCFLLSCRKEKHCKKQMVEFVCYRIRGPMINLDAYRERGTCCLLS